MLRWFCIMQAHIQTFVSTSLLLPHNNQCRDFVLEGMGIPAMTPCKGERQKDLTEKESCLLWVQIRQSKPDLLTDYLWRIAHNSATWSISQTSRLSPEGRGPITTFLSILSQQSFSPTSWFLVAPTGTRKSWPSGWSVIRQSFQDVIFYPLPTQM